MENLTKDKCKELLRQKYDSILLSGENRYPKKGDFTPEQVAAIKSFYGPWPKALTEVGIKPKDSEKEEKKQKKRIQHKKKMREYKLDKNKKKEQN